jgi:hypothetical protein
LSNQHILLKDNLKWIGWQVDLKVVRRDESNRNAASSGIVLDEPACSPTNGTTRFKNVNNCFKTNTSSYLETSGGQSSNIYFYFVHFFNTRVIKTSVAA